MRSNCSSLMSVGIHWYTASSKYTKFDVHVSCKSRFARLIGLDAIEQVDGILIIDQCYWTSSVDRSCALHAGFAPSQLEKLSKVQEPQ